MVLVVTEGHVIRGWDMEKNLELLEFPMTQVEVVQEICSSTIMGFMIEIVTLIHTRKRHLYCYFLVIQERELLSAKTIRMVAGLEN